MTDQIAGIDEEAVCGKLTEIVASGGVRFVLHEHEPTRTIDDAVSNLSFDVGRIVKTVAFRTREGCIILAALRGTRRVDYARLAAAIGVNRRDLASLSPGEVTEALRVEPGSVSPLLPLYRRSILLIDQDVLSICPTLYCGIGRSDRTLEIAAVDLVRLTGGLVTPFSREMHDGK